MSNSTNLFNNINKVSMGIDLGTTNSVVTVSTSNSKDTVISVDDSRTMPSCVEWLGGDNFIVGKEAYRHKLQDNVAYSFKKYMGTKHKIKLTYKGETREFTPEFLSSKVLERLHEVAKEWYPGISKAVISVPAQFSHASISATKKAGELAGIGVLDTNREPSCASLVYETGEELKTTVLIFDFGGGTLDVVIAEIEKIPNPKDIYDFYGFEKDYDDDKIGRNVRILGTDGCTSLGGDDLDDMIAEVLMDRLDVPNNTGQSFWDLNPNADKEYLFRLFKSKAVVLKKMEGAFQTHLINIQVNPDKNIDYSYEVQASEKDYKEQVANIYKKCKVYLNRLMDNTRLTKPLDRIVTVGGSTKSKYMKELLSKDFPGIIINDSINPDEAVGIGAGISAVEMTTGSSDIRLTEILPLALGVRTENKISRLIQKDTLLPTKNTKIYTTTEDNQSTVSIDIYQGNSLTPQLCENLGSIVIDNIPEGPAGSIDIIVTFKITFSGIVTCTAIVGDRETKLEFKDSIGKITETVDDILSASQIKRATRWESRAKKLDDSYLLDLVNKYKENPTDQIQDRIIKHISDSSK